MNNNIKAENYLNLVWKVINDKFSNCPYLEKEDMFQIGCLGLVNCIRYYDENQGEFLNYAYSSILRQIYKEYKKQYRRKDILNSISLDQPIGNNDNNDNITLRYEVIKDENFSIDRNLISKDFTGRVIKEAKKNMSKNKINRDLIALLDNCIDYVNKNPDDNNFTFMDIYRIYYKGKITRQTLYNKKQKLSYYIKKAYKKINN